MLKKSKKKSPKTPKTPKPYQFIPLYEDRFYRRNEVVKHRYLGLGNTALEAKIKSGAIDPPISLGGRATGWFGRTLIKLQSQFAVKPSTTRAA